MRDTSKLSDGGAAFPTDNIFGGRGMSLRDWFAGQALEFCLREFGGNPDDGKQFAEAAYQIADAMLAERNK